MPLALSSSKTSLSWDSREVAQPASGRLRSHPDQRHCRAQEGQRKLPRLREHVLSSQMDACLGCTLASGKHTDLLKVSGPGTRPRMLMECWFLLPCAQSMGFDPPPEHPEVAGGFQPLIQPLTPNCYQCKSKLPTSHLPVQERELSV